LVRKTDPDRAIADYSETIRHAPKDASIYSDRCFVRAAAGRDLQMALNDCNFALKILPGDAGVVDNRGFSYNRLGRFDEAVEDYTRVLSVDPKHAQAMYGRGLAKSRKGDDTGGKADIKAAIAIQGDIADAYARLGEKP